MIKLAEKTCRDADCEKQNPQPASAFYPHKTNPDRLSSYCRACHSRRHRKDYVPKAERVDVNPFDETALFNNLNLALACIGMAQTALCRAAADLVLTTDTKPDKAIYSWSKSAILLSKQAANNINWIIDAKRFQAKERQKNDHRPTETKQR